jgi:hypothetical protein
MLRELRQLHACISRIGQSDANKGNRQELACGGRAEQESQ